MIESKFYDKGFYAEQEYTSYLSGKKIIPLINDLFQPKSVVDIGCGLGNWLKVWAEDFNMEDFLGVEGPYVNPEMLMVPKNKVIFADLKQKLILNRQFDLVMSMEVAEHIEPDCAEVFIENLTSLGDIIIFSAAIPNQEGTYHINEQNPEYWAELFEQQGFKVIDFFRKKIWNDKEINYWYRQNILLFIKEDKISNFPSLQKSLSTTDKAFLLRIHPELLASKMVRLNKIEPISGYIHWQLYMLKIKMKKAFKFK